MAKTDVGIRKYRGYKFFRESEDGEIELIRIMAVSLYNNKVQIRYEETGKRKLVNFYTLKDDGYTALEPYGVMGVSIVKCFLDKEKKQMTDDVIITLYRKKELDIGSQCRELSLPPYAVCRQGINDFFYNMIATDPDHGLVGISVTRDNCPANIPYDMVCACDEVKTFNLIHLYRDDTLESMLSCLGVDEAICNETMEKIYKGHCDNLMLPEDQKKKIFEEQEEHSGWCKNLRELLIQNSFITDFNTMCGITALDFNLEDYLVKKEEDEVDNKLNPEALEFFRNTFKVNAVDTHVIEYGYDIDLADFNNTCYTLLKDIQDKLYVVVYTVEGEYLEKDLEERNLRMDVSDRLRLSYYNKYAGKSSE